MSRWILGWAVLWGLAGCASHDWRVAERANTGEAYRAFVTANPDHPRVEQAKDRAERLDWARAVELDTPEAYLAYVGAFPTGPHAADAVAAAEERAWSQVQREGTPEALATYLARFPDTNRRGEVEDLIEAGWYDRAVQENTEDAWSRYLIRYPQGQFVEAAKAERERLAWESTTRENTRWAFERFVMKYPASARFDEAEQWIEASRVRVLQPVVVLGASTVPDDKRALLAGMIKQELQLTLLYDLRQDFEILRPILVDLNGGPEPHPQQAYGIKPDTGLLVLTYHDKAGREFKPTGRATDISAKLELYAPPTDKPTWTVSFEASTPERVRATTVEGLREAAIRRLGTRLRGFAPELRNERRTLQ